MFWVPPLSGSLTDAAYTEEHNAAIENVRL